MIFALCCFSQGCDPDPDAAAAALSRAGYEVIRRPLALKIERGLEGDDFIEIRRAGNNDDEDARDAMEAEVERIVAPFGGAIDPSGCLTIAELWEPKTGKNGKIIWLPNKESEEMPF
jgi:hypothetical protein